MTAISITEGLFITAVLWLAVVAGLTFGGWRLVRWWKNRK
jgi:hypothetical protein